MNQIITEKDYPVEFRWIYKAVFGFILASIISLVLFFFGYVNFYLYILVIFSPIQFILTILRRSRFHFALEEKFLTVKQGIVSKKERHTPYGVVQNVFVKQDIIDRIFNFCSLVIENATQNKNEAKREKSRNYFWGGIFGSVLFSQSLGSRGSKVNIPGLKKENAEKLKTLVLEKMKINPIVDSGSGL